MARLSSHSEFPIAMARQPTLSWDMTTSQATNRASLFLARPSEDMEIGSPEGNSHSTERCFTFLKTTGQTACMEGPEVSTRECGRESIDRAQMPKFSC